MAETKGGPCEPGGFCQGDPRDPARCHDCRHWPLLAYLEPVRPAPDTSLPVWQRRQKVILGGDILGGIVLGGIYLARRQPQRVRG